MNALICPEDDSKGHISDLLVDDGGDMTLQIHEGNKAQDLLLKDITTPDPISTDNAEFKVVQTVIKRQLEGGETDKWKKIDNKYTGFSEGTSTGVQHLFNMENTCTNHQK